MFVNNPTAKDDWASWSYNRNTRKNEPVLTFRKYTQKGILIIVEMHMSRSKILSLKTLYEAV